jgi:trk system potassium uptake protein
MYMIIVGAGSIGTSLIDIATKDKNNVVVIETDPKRAKELSNKYDITVLNANATAAETLREAGSDRADALITTTGDDAINLMVVSIADRLKIPSIVAVVNDREHAEFFRKLGANVLENPEDVVANHLYTAVRQPKLRDYTILPQGEQVFRIGINKGSPLIGHSLSESAERGILPKTAMVTAIERDGKKDIAADETVVNAEDLLTLFTLERMNDEQVDKLTG